MDLLQAFEIIVDKAKNSSLGEKFYEEADSYPLIPQHYNLTLFISS